jgi:hypothetical protein
MNERDAPQNQEGRKDGLLCTFVHMVEKGLSLSITLSVGGMLVSGILISYSEYLGLVSDQMKSIPVHYPQCRGDVGFWNTHQLQ